MNNEEMQPILHHLQVGEAVGAAGGAAEGQYDGPLPAAQQQLCVVRHLQGRRKHVQDGNENGEAYTAKIKKDQRLVASSPAAASCHTLQSSYPPLQI